MQDQLIRICAELKIENWQKSKMFFKHSSGIYIKGKLDTGHQGWKYSDFKEVLSCFKSKKEFFLISIIITEKNETRCKYLV